MKLYDWMLTTNNLEKLSQDDKMLLGAVVLANSTIDEDSDCWLWNGLISPQGYGRVRLNVIPSVQSKDYKWVAVHRLCYMLNNGSIPEGYRVGHICDEPSCCNPKHLILRR